jgi:hypothetical protein
MKNSLASPALDIQEALKILRFRFQRDVAFRPVRERGGVAYYSVDGKLRPESEILRWAERGQPPASQSGFAS